MFATRSQLPCSDACFCYFYGFDVAVGVEIQVIDAGDAVIAIGLAERAAVVDDVVVVGVGDMDEGVMAGARGDGGVLLENFADALERTCWGVRDRISDGVVGTGPAAFGPHKIVFPIAGEHPWAFDIAFWGDLFEGGTIGEGFEAGEVGLEAGDITMPPTPIDHIVLIVLVFEDGHVDRLGSVMEFVDEGFSYIIFVRAFGLVCDGDADAADGAVILDIVGGEEEIVFPVLVGDRGRPHRAVSPADGGGVEDMRVLCPVDEVGGGEGVEEDLFVVFIGVGGVDPIGVVEDRGFGVGVPAGEDWVAGGLGGGGCGEAKEGGGEDEFSHSCKLKN